MTCKMKMKLFKILHWWEKKYQHFTVDLWQQQKGACQKRNRRENNTAVYQTDNNIVVGIFKSGGVRSPDCHGLSSTVS